MNSDKHGCQFKVKNSDGESKWITLNKESANILMEILKKKNGNLKNYKY